MSPVGRVRSIVFECGDPRLEAEFWSAVLGRDIADREDDWWALAHGADGPRLAFQVVDGYRAPPWPGTTGEQQVHLDVEVDDLDAATTTVLGLGASTLSDVIDSDGDVWRVFADPAGHPFCLVPLR